MEEKHSNLRLLGCPYVLIFWDSLQRCTIVIINSIPSQQCPNLTINYALPYYLPM